MLFGLGEYTSKLTEAFADVMASYLISHYIWPKIGPSAWPDPYDYSTEGEKSFLERVDTEEYSRYCSPEFAKFLWSLHVKKSPAFVGRIVNALPVDGATEADFRRLAEAGK